jgi:hypothetical protein
MSRRPLQPTEAASALLHECEGRRKDAEQRAWQQYLAFQGQDGEEHISTRYWLTVWSAIVDREEKPPVPDAIPPGQKRFDATGKVITDTPLPTLGLVHSETEH